MMNLITPREFRASLETCHTRLEVFEFLHHNFQHLHASDAVKQQILDYADELADKKPEPHTCE